MTELRTVIKQLTYFNNTLDDLQALKH